MPHNPTDDSTSKKPTSVAFHYVKSPQFRTVHVDGVIGGITPAGSIHMAVYAERPAIPQSVEHAIGDDHALGSVVRTTGKDGIVREMDFNAVMSIDVAKLIHAWLGDWITRVEAIKEQTK